MLQNRSTAKYQVNTIFNIIIYLPLLQPSTVIVYNNKYCIVFVLYLRYLGEYLTISYSYSLLLLCLKSADVNIS